MHFSCILPVIRRELERLRFWGLSWQVLCCMQRKVNGGVILQSILTFLDHSMGIYFLDFNASILVSLVCSCCEGQKTRHHHWTNAKQNVPRPSRTIVPLQCRPAPMQQTHERAAMPVRIQLLQTPKHCLLQPPFLISSSRQINATWWLNNGTAKHVFCGTLFG